MSFQQVLVHESIGLNHLSQWRLDSLRTGQIHHALHYQSLQQSKLWLELFHKHSPAVTAPQVGTIYQELAQAAAQPFKGQPVQVISLGCGAGRKDLLLLRALVKVGAQVRWTPQDISLSLVLLAAKSASDLPLTALHPVVADLQALPHLAAAFDPIDATTPRIYTFYGLVPNFDPAFLLSCWSGLLRPQDQLLVSANLSPTVDESKSAYLAATEKIQPQYDNPETEAWLTTLLKDWGIYDRLTNYRIRLESRHEWLRLVAVMDWRESFDLPWENQTLSLHKGDNLRLFFSYRYTPERFKHLALQAGLNIREEFVANNQEEGVWSLGAS